MKNIISFKCLSWIGISPFVLLMLTQVSFTNKSMAQGCTLACNDQITVAVPINGSHELLPDEILEGDPSMSCPNGIFSAQAQFNNSWLPASGNMVFDETHIGLNVLCRVRDEVSGNSCWGNVEIVQAPSLDTIKFQLCSELWQAARPLKGTRLFFQPNNTAFPYAPVFVDLGPNQNCVEMSIVPSDYLPGTTFSYGGYIVDTNLLNNYINGVNLLDLCETAGHILGVLPFPSPYAMIAADVNQSGSITTFDIVESRKLILGIYTQLPNNTNWKVMPDYCQFPNPNNPFGSFCANHLILSEFMALDGDTAKVFGIKVGDVNGDVTLPNTPGYLPTVTDSLNFILPQGSVAAGTQVVIPVKMDKGFLYGGLQAQFYIDPTVAQYESVSEGAVDISSQSQGSVYYNPATSMLTITYLASFSTGTQFVPEGAVHFNIHLTALQNAAYEDVLEINGDAPANTFGFGQNCGDYIEFGASYTGTVPTFTPVSQGLRIQAPSPNPFEAQTTLGIELEGTETAQLEIVDLTGRVLYSEEKTLQAGFNPWEIPGAVLPSGGLGFWRLKIGGQISSGKLARK